MPKPGFFSRIAAKILAFDQTELPEQQFAMIQDMIANQNFQIKGKEAKQLLACLKRKHSVNSITALRGKNGMVFSSTGNGASESRNGKQILNFVNSNFAQTDVITMRTEQEWVMLMPFHEDIYIVKANSALSPVELRALSRDVEAVLKKRRLN